MRGLWQFALHTLRAVTKGSSAYYRWVALLAALVALGAVGYVRQLRDGMAITGMSDQIAWGAYIANFTFLVGAAAAAVMLVVPTYLYRDHALKDSVIFGEQFAFCAMVMCLMFVMVDIGRPDRFWHMVPGLGRFNWPQSMLSWDVIALGGYLMLNGGLTLYLVYCKFHKRRATSSRYRPFVYLAIPWAIGIHTVTAFLYSGLGGRPHWHAAVLAPRFLASAFASGPALMILALSAIEYYGRLDLDPRAINRLRQIAVVAMMINLFLVGSEVFTELYAHTHHAAALQYAMFGLHGHTGLVPFVWTSLALNVFALAVFALRRFHRHRKVLLLAAAASVLGAWLEKGITFVVSGFVPTPLGEVVDYLPTFEETAVSVGIWAGGLLLFTFLVKATVPIELEARERAHG